MGLFFCSGLMSFVLLSERTSYPTAFKVVLLWRAPSALSSASSGYGSRSFMAEDPTGWSRTYTHPRTLHRSVLVIVDRFCSVGFVQSLSQSDVTEHLYSTLSGIYSEGLHFLCWPMWWRAQWKSAVDFLWMLSNVVYLFFVACKNLFICFGIFLSYVHHLRMSWICFTVSLVHFHC